MLLGLPALSPDGKLLAFFMNPAGEGPAQKKIALISVGPKRQFGSAHS
jgi:hypothetical protein